MSSANKKFLPFILIAPILLLIWGMVNMVQVNIEDENVRDDKWTKRSMVIGQNGAVATSHPLAALAGLDILKKGGNAIDAAIATAAVLNVVEHGSTGIGGDAFAIVYLAKEKKVVGLNASGRAPKSLTREKLIERGYERMPQSGIIPVTVPGAFDGWVTLLETYGTMSLQEVLSPAINYAENGFPVTEIISWQWEQEVEKLQKQKIAAETMLINGRAPRVGEVFYQKNLANTFRKLAKGGRDAFYNGFVAEEIVKTSKELGGFLSMEDFASHTSTWVEPIFVDYKNFRLYELPPNGQGIAALEMLNILENVDMKSLGHNSAEYVHMLVETKKLAFADIRQWVADPEFNDLPIERMLSKEYAKQQFGRIDTKKAAERVDTGIPHSGDTIYLTVMDKDNNAVSFINSTYSHFGSGVVAGSTGIVLQNRGALFVFDEGHPNMLEPEKRPFHTIIPPMLFKDGEFYSSFGVMSGSMQPQGHVQVVLNIVEFGMNIQEAIEAPRVRHFSGFNIMLEPEFDVSIRSILEQMGHNIRPHRPFSYGGGQGIVFDISSGVKMAGSDFRKDGMAVAY